VTLDEWTKRNGKIAIELLKFDIQDVELQALRGAVDVFQNSTVLVYTEILFNPLYEDGAVCCEIDPFL